MKRPWTTFLGISNGNVVFDENRKYSYLFSGNTTIIAPTETEQGISVVSIEGNANIVGTEKCGAILYLKNLEITHGSKVSVFSFAESNFFFVKLQKYNIL